MVWVKVTAGPSYKNSNPLQHHAEHQQRHSIWVRTSSAHVVDMHTFNFIQLNMIRVITGICEPLFIAPSCSIKTSSAPRPCEQARRQGRPSGWDLSWPLGALSKGKQVSDRFYNMLDVLLLISRRFPEVCMKLLARGGFA